MSCPRTKWNVSQGCSSPIPPKQGNPLDRYHQMLTSLLMHWKLHSVKKHVWSFRTFLRALMEFMFDVILSTAPCLHVLGFFRYIQTNQKLHSKPLPLRSIRYTQYCFSSTTLHEKIDHEWKHCCSIHSNSLYPITDWRRS